MALLDPVDIYCERTDVGLWAEPLNAVTNISFFIAAWLLWRSYSSPRRGEAGRGASDERSLDSCPHPSPPPMGEGIILIPLVALVGLGSFLFHTFANELTQWADVIPIGLFVFYYLWLSLRRLLGCSLSGSIIALSVFFAAMVLVSDAPPEYSFNGSIAYFPCWIAIVWVGFGTRRRDANSSILLSRAALCFAVSLTFRSIDMAICPGFPIGSHFLWHLLNGVVLYLLAKAVLTANSRCAPQ